MVAHATKVSWRRATPAASGEASLVVRASPGRALEGARRTIAVDVLDLGRGEPGSAGEGLMTLDDELVSRLHARIVRTGQGHLLVDLESTNGTLLNGEPVHEATLRHGDLVQLGNTVLRYELAGPERR